MPVSYTHLDVYKRQNKNFIPIVGKLMTQQPLGFCKEDFGTNEYWTLQLIKSSRKHKLELRNDSGEVRLFESYTSGVFFSSSMVVDLELEANQETTCLLYTSRCV